jgi:hypothetical protein
MKSVFAIGQTRKEAQEWAIAGYFQHTKADADEIMRVKPSGVDDYYWGLLHVYKVEVEDHIDAR